MGTQYMEKEYDIREYYLLLDEIAKRDNLLHAVNEVATILLSHKDGFFEEMLTKGIKLISSRLSVDRTYIWKNEIIDNQLNYVNLYEWVENDEQPGLIVHPDMHYRYGNTPRWENELSHDRCINGPVKMLPANERKALLPFNVKSILVIPVHLEDEFWGLVSFDDCKTERWFSEDEVDILRSASLIIVNAIIKFEMNRDMKIASEKLKEALQKAQDASDAKSSFLSKMSHEIRTPMNAIIGMTRIGKSAMDTEKMIYTLDKIDGASKHLLGVINDILDISKIEANKLTLSDIEFNFEKVIESIINIIRFRSEEKNQKIYVHLNKNIPEYLIGDDQRLSQVITNLFSNAIKFTPQGNNIYLNAHYKKNDEGNGTLTVSVKDTGIGISEEQQVGLFSSFNQADSGISRRYGGTGLGLAISKHIVELMDGKIWIESELGNGSNFTFTVRIKESTERDKNFIPMDADMKKYSLLLMSDDKELTDYFGYLSDQLGVSWNIMTDVKSTLAAAKEQDTCKICFMDWDMETVDYRSLCNEIYPFRNSSTKFVMTSWYNKVFVEQDYRLVGINMFLPKPLFRSNIIHSIKKCTTSKDREDIKIDTDDGVESLEGFRLLLVEDLDINREIVMAILEPTLIDVSCAENGLEAVKMYEENEYDIILMDIKMPIMDGYEATRKIRELEADNAGKIPVIAMTANVFREDVEMCIDAGMDDHLGKPLDTEKLLEKLYEFLGGDD